MARKCVCDCWNICLEFVSVAVCKIKFAMKNRNPYRVPLKMLGRAQNTDF